MSNRILIKGGTVVTEEKICRADILICGEIIERIAEDIAPEDDMRVIDARGMQVFPGFIDSHVHYYAPCGRDKTIDDFTSGSIGAVCGGVTTVVDYAYPRPGMDLTEALHKRMDEAQGWCYTDYTFHSEIMGWYGWTEEELAAVRREGIDSLKAYTTYGEDKLSYTQTEALLEDAKKRDLLVTVHAEDDDICRDRREQLTREGKISCAYHGESRPDTAEAAAIEKLLAAAEKTGGRLHIVHVSTEKGIALIEDAKKRGVAVTCETCPQYLFLTEDKYSLPTAGEYVLTPPLRKKTDNEALWNSLLSGTIDSVVSDHCAFSTEEKLSADSCFCASPGLPGTETIIHILYSEGKKRGLREQDIARIFSANPAKLFGLYPGKGSLLVGTDADLTIIDPDKAHDLTWTELHSRSGYSVYEGYRSTVAVEYTLVRGKILVENGKFAGQKPEGRFVSANR